MRLWIVWKIWKKNIENRHIKKNTSLIRGCVFCYRCKKKLMENGKYYVILMEEKRTKTRFIQENIDNDEKHKKNF